MRKFFKESKFNIKSEVDDKLIIFNSLTQGLLEVEGEIKDKIQSILEKKELIDEIDEDIKQNLLHGGIIVPNNVDELANLKLITNMDKYNSKSLDLTIAPTLECNFGCTYCYEKGVRYNTMNSEVKTNTIDFISNNLQGVSNLNICWYGGEPLLKIELIDELTEKIKELCKDDISYNAMMVTNGYLLTPEIAKKLNDMNIKNIQITLDGNRKIHDSRRFLINKEGTFDTIIKNIDECKELLNITIRINVDKTNFENTYELLEILKEKNIAQKVSFYIAQVDNINNSCSNTTCLSDIEFSESEVLFYKKAFEMGIYKFNFPKNITSFCGAVTLNSYVIDPKGNLYKCWNTIGNEKYKIGNVKNKIPNLNQNLTSWINYNQEGEKCKECNVFPLCNGGCPYHYLKNNEHKCMSFKNNNKDIIDLFYKQQISK